MAPRLWTDLVWRCIISLHKQHGFTPDGFLVDGFGPLSVYWGSPPPQFFFYSSSLPSCQSLIQVYRLNWCSCHDKRQLVHVISSNVKLQRSEGHCDHIYQRPVVSCLLQKHDAQVSLKTYCLHEVVNVDRRRKHRWRDETVNLLSNDVFDLVVDQSQVVVDLSLRHRQRESQDR